MRQIELNISTTSEYPIEMIADYDEFIDDESESEIKLEANNKISKTSKNKRKTLIPQRASPIEMLGEDSQTSQSSMEYNSSSAADDAYDESEQANNEEEIMRGICEETNGEAVDAKMLDDVKEEWQAKSGIKCNMCKKLFQYKSEFDNHYQSKHNRVPVYTCSFCNRSMDKYSSFRSHSYRHITEGRYKCKDCKQGFSLQSLLQVHILAKHSKVKPYNCDECGKSFATKPGLKIHAKKHQGEVKEDYPCAECGKILLTRGGLTSHMNVHRLGRRFMCDVCGKTFTQKVNMQQHVKQHTGDKPYKCDKCGKTFAERSHLSRHNSFHSNDRPYKCDVCGKMYKTERCLKVHSLVHGKERPYVCTYCNKGFLSSTKLKQHYNIHTGERPFACKYCERKFTNYPNWLKHTRRRHNVDHKTGKVLSPKKTTELNVQPESSLDNVESYSVLSGNIETKCEQANNEEEIMRGICEETNDDDSIKLEIKAEPIRISLDSELYEADYDKYALTVAPISDLLPNLETIDHEPIHHDNLTTDFKLSKTDELFLQQNILNFPITDMDESIDNSEMDSFANDIQILQGSTSSQFDLIPLQFIQ